MDGNLELESKKFLGLPDDRILDCRILWPTQIYCPCSVAKTRKLGTILKQVAVTALAVSLITNIDFSNSGNSFDHFENCFCLQSTKYQIRCDI